MNYFVNVLTQIENGNLVCTDCKPEKIYASQIPADTVSYIGQDRMVAVLAQMLDRPLAVNDKPLRVKDGDILVVVMDSKDGKELLFYEIIVELN